MTLNSPKMTAQTHYNSGIFHRPIRQPAPVIIDCDNSFGIPGCDIDDGLALLYLLGQSACSLQGITLTYGNASLKRVVRATQRFVGRLGHFSPSLVPGASSAGENPGRNRAARYLVDQAQNHEGELIVVATGPLGNLDAAAQLDPEFYQRLRHLYIMGGCLGPVRSGIRPCGELNFSADPVATRNVLASPCAKTLITAEPCLSAPFGWREAHEALHHLPGWIKSASLRWLTLYGLGRLTRRCYLWDVLPALAINHPELFTTQDVILDETQSDFGRGFLSVTPAGSLAAHHASQLRLVTGVRDPQAMLNLAAKAWRRATETSHRPSLGAIPELASG